MMVSNEGMVMQFSPTAVAGADYSTELLAYSDWLCAFKKAYATPAEPKKQASYP